MTQTIESIKSNRQGRKEFQINQILLKGSFLDTFLFNLKDSCGIEMKGAEIAGG